jgi:hypothetical protein
VKRAGPLVYEVALFTTKGTKHTKIDPSNPSFTAKIAKAAKTEIEMLVWNFAFFANFAAKLRCLGLAFVCFVPFVGKSNRL